MHLLFAGVALWSCEARASCKVLHLRWRIKNCMAVASGTKQNTEAFCFFAKNRVLFCGDISVTPDTGFTSGNVQGQVLRPF